MRTSGMSSEHASTTRNGQSNPTLSTSGTRRREESKKPIQHRVQNLGQQTRGDAPHPAVVGSSGSTRRHTRNRTATKRFRPEIDGLCDAEKNSLKTAEPTRREEKKTEEEHNNGKEDDKAEHKVSDATLQMTETEGTQEGKSEADVSARQKEGTAPTTGVGVPRSRARKERPPPVVQITVEEFRKQQRRQHGLAQIIEYLETNVLPSGRLSQIEVLELAPVYAMDEFDVLCKATAGNTRENGMRWVVPENLYTWAIDTSECCALIK